MIPLIASNPLVVTFPSFLNAQAAIVPLVIVALLVDAAILGIWYMLGYAIGNSSVKKTAVGEIWQLAGTAALISIVVFALVIFSGLFQSALNGTALMSSAALGSLSANIEATTQVSLLQSCASSAPSVSGPGQGTCGFSGPLNAIITGNGPDALTSSIDYPLAAVGIIVENLTDQTVTNLNSMFVVDSYIGFLSTIEPTFTICVSVPGFDCLTPIPVPRPAVAFSWSGAPYAGLEMIYRGMGALGILFTSAAESFIMQLTFIVIFLYAWPFLIFGGLVLRATPFTRKIGGLFIAVAIGALFFYPAVFTVQYLVLGRGFGNVPVYNPSDVFALSSNSISTIYGYNSISTNPISNLPNQNLNFFVMPSVKQIAQANGCWPPGGSAQGALTAEQNDILTQLIPGVSLIELVASLGGGLLGSYPPLILWNQCTPQPNAMNTLFGFLDAYGAAGITAYLLPLMDLLITLSAIIGLSGLLGGDTELAGLSRLV
jgi:ABC-type multidrug transport system fused ATPase/permease subunit